MKSDLFLIKEILASHKIRKVLDIGAGKGFTSLFCASYGADVDAVDDNSLKEFSFPPLLKSHPKISFYNIPIEEFSFTQMYDLIIITNVVMFLDKQIFLNTLLPKVVSSLSEGGYIVLSFFGEEDQFFKKTVSHYEIQDFMIPGLLVTEHFDKSISEDHPPYGPHKHHIHYVVLRKSLV